MSEPGNPQSVDFEETSSRLGEGLRSCRAVLSGYRVLLGRSADRLDDIDIDHSRKSDGTMDPSNDC